MNKGFRLTLLHIDANPGDQLLLRTALESTGSFNFVGADSLQAAVDYIVLSRRKNRRHPAVILIDYSLGIHHGTDFLYWLRVQHRNTAVPVIIYSGTSVEDQVGQCYALGANHFLRKPRGFARVKLLVLALRVCFSRMRPDFRFLDCLPEAMPDPRVSAPATA